MAHLKDFVGLRYGNLTLIEFTGWRDSKQLWKARCDCGNSIIVNLENVERGKLKSCGCMKDPDSIVFMMNAEKKILSLIDKQEDCWIWKGMIRKEYVERDGERKGFYPYCNFNHEQLSPVRFFKRMLGEKCPKNYTFKKICHTWNCVNPDHYKLKSISRVRQDNIKEKNDRTNN